MIIGASIFYIYIIYLLFYWLFCSFFKNVVVPFGHFHLLIFFVKTNFKWWDILIFEDKKSFDLRAVTYNCVPLPNTILLPAYTHQLTTAQKVFNGKTIRQIHCTSCVRKQNTKINILRFWELYSLIWIFNWVPDPNIIFPTPDDVTHWYKG